MKNSLVVFFGDVFIATALCKYCILYYSERAKGNNFYLMQVTSLFTCLKLVWTVPVCVPKWNIWMGLFHILWLTPGPHTHLCFPRKQNWEHDGHQSSSFQGREHIDEPLKKLIEINLLSVIWQKEDIALHITPKFIILYFPFIPSGFILFVSNETQLSVHNYVLLLHNFPSWFMALSPACPLHVVGMFSSGLRFQNR